MMFALQHTELHQYDIHTSDALRNLCQESVEKTSMCVDHWALASVASRPAIDPETLIHHESFIYQDMHICTWQFPLQEFVLRIPSAGEMEPKRRCSQLTPLLMLIKNASLEILRSPVFSTKAKPALRNNAADQFYF